MSTNQNPEPGWLARLLEQLRSLQLRPLLVLALAMSLSTLVVTFAVDTDGPDGPAPPVTFTVQVPFADTGTKARELTAPAAAVRAAERSDVGDHQDARDESPPGVPAGELEQGKEQQEHLAKTNGLPPLSPLAAPEQRGCRSMFVRNQSSRNGVRPRLIVMHETISPNRPGWDDINGLTAFSNNPASGVSWTYNVDFEGNCAYTVPETRKPWTQAGFNPVSIGIEVVNQGGTIDGSYAGVAGLKKLGMVVSDSARRWEIPLQRAVTVGCVVVKPGIADHQQLGACGGNHSDISPYKVQEVIDAARAFRRSEASPLTAVELRIVAGATSPRGTGHSRRYWCARNVARRARLLQLGRTQGWKLERGVRYQLLGRSYKASCHIR